MLSRIDPLHDARWAGLLARHTQASVFHTPEWLGALKRTYGYEPFVLTTSPPGEELKNGIAFCRVKSWLTGDRIVSVPFADHCQPLMDSPRSLQVLLDELREEQRRGKWKYIELRPTHDPLAPSSQEAGSFGNGSVQTPHPIPFIAHPLPQRAGFVERGGPGEVRRPLSRVTSNHGGDDTPRLSASAVKPFDGAEGAFGKSAEFYFHSLDLRPDLESLYSNLHKSCVQRKIQRAEREQVGYEVGRSEILLTQFYHLLLLTRRRHQLPPQPLEWFRNLLEGLGDGARIHVASKDGQPIASILTLFFKNTLLYKYGCSDGKFHNLGGMPLLFWKAIQEGKQLGAEEFDLGRSDLDNPGLAEFKGHLGAACSTLTYYSYPPRAPSSTALGWKMRIARSTFGWLPDSLLTTVGRLLYKHVG